MDEPTAELPEQPEAEAPGLLPTAYDAPAKSTEDSFAATYGEHSGFLLAVASRHGRMHREAGQGREDRCLVAVREAQPQFLLTVADGAGSCAHAARAAELATTTLVRVAETELELGLLPEDALAHGLEAASQELECAAAGLGKDVREFGTTLLAVLWRASDVGGGTCWSVQVGDGLIAAATHDGVLTPLAVADSGDFACETLFLHHLLAQPISERIRRKVFTEPPAALLLMTDGLADDIVPHRIGGPLLLQGIEKSMATSTPGAALLDLLGYEKRGSWDDRTLVVAWRVPGRTS